MNTNFLLVDSATDKTQTNGLNGAAGIRNLTTKHIDNNNTNNHNHNHGHSNNKVARRK
jgi:hypothetical protein